MYSDMDDMNFSTAIPPHEVLPCNNPRNVVSPYVAEMVDLVVYVGMFPVLVTFGFITNVINMAVFARQGLSDRINLCLFSLAVSDTGFLLFLMCSKSYALISLLDPVEGNYWQKRHHSLVLATSLGCLAISNITTALIAVERCLCILSPLKAASFFKTRTLRVVIGVVAVYILTVLNTAFGIKYQTVHVVDPLTNTSTFISRLSPTYLRHRTLIDIVYNSMLLVILPFLCLLTVTVCTTAIIVRLKVSAAWRRETASNVTSAERQDVSVTRMLVTVCCVYVTCMTPTVTRQLAIFGRVPGFLYSGHLCNLFRVSSAITHLLELTNTSCNFLIYIKQSSRYRSALKMIPSDHIASPSDTSPSDHITSPSDTSPSDHITSPSDTSRSDHITSRSDHITSPSDHITSSSDYITSRSDHITSRSDHITSRCDYITSRPDYITSRCDYITSRPDYITSRPDYITSRCDHITSRCDHITSPSDHITSRSDQSRLEALSR
ncbi:uncharacterized protein LOC143290996 [Babylonia areolata]|uniref:uncharacterized protein LOC143290996 n=1 Tax=Babylonia areolata TaxID=304850 RepID=UPI003FD32D5A